MPVTVHHLGVQPSRFGTRFRVHGESGAGGMATVYRATDLVTGQDVALKVLHERTGAERLHEEAALIAGLAHPAIVRYIDHGITAGGERYLVTEWLEGETLERRLQRGPLGIIETLRLGRRVLEALAVAHRQGIVHRDVKPANLLLPGGDLGQAKLLDFGIAARAADLRRLISVGASGTPAYMSPEQVRGDDDVDARSDLFSLGCVLYECLTGHTPFPGESPLAVMAAMFLDRGVSVEVHRPDLPAAVSALLTRMLSTDPAGRPASAAALAQQLGELIAELGAAGLATGERAAVPQLADGERRVVSAIVASRPRAGEASTGTRDVPGDPLLEALDEASLTRIREAVAPFGAEAELVLGTTATVTVTVRSGGTPSDVATRAARCALVLKGLLPRFGVAVGTGGAASDSEALGALVSGTVNLLAGGAPGVIRLDPTTAGLVESRFELTPDEGGRRLLFEKGITEAPRTVPGKPIPG